MIEKQNKLSEIQALLRQFPNSYVDIGFIPSEIDAWIKNLQSILNAPSSGNKHTLFMKQVVSMENNPSKKSEK